MHRNLRYDIEHHCCKYRRKAAAHLRTTVKIAVTEGLVPGTSTCANHEEEKFGCNGSWLGWLVGIPRDQTGKCSSSCLLYTSDAADE